MSDLLAPGYSVRHPDVADLDAVYAVIVASEIEEFGESQGYTIDELAGDWTQFDLGRDAWVAMSPDGALAGYGYVEDRGHVRLDVEIYVHPLHYGRGIGTTLVRLAEVRAQEHVTQAPPGTRVVVNNWINARNPDACSLLERVKTCGHSTRRLKRPWPITGGTCRDRMRSGESDALDRILTPVCGSSPGTVKSPPARSCVAFPMPSVGSKPSWCVDPGAGAGSATPC